MRPVILNVRQWQEIRAMLHQEHPRTVFMLRTKMKDVLGFTVRDHTAWIGKPKAEYEQDVKAWEQRQSQLTNKNDPFTMLDWEPSKGHSASQVHLDFYSERKRTMFLLKFSEILAKKEN